MNAIEFKKLKKIYRGKIAAVDGIDLTIPKSTIFGIIGPNGAGKSTIINILAGLVNKTKGEVKILGSQIQKGDYEYKRDVGFVLEQPHYIEKLSVVEYLHFAGTMYEIETVEIEKRTSELINFLRLKEKENDWIESYSTGMKKKVSLAAALIHQPKILILDEPLEGIDPVSVKQIKDNLRLMVEKGVTVLISSHNLDSIEKMCDEVGIIDKGKLVFQAKTKDIHQKINKGINKEIYHSLEDIFVDTIIDDNDKGNNKLSWL